ncbi:hypothetical protein P9112_004893 [Eukaryota sp. TZLM1-RC]
MFKRILSGTISSDDEPDSPSHLAGLESQDEDVSCDELSSPLLNNDNDELPDLDNLSEDQLLELLDKEGLLHEFAGQMASVEAEKEENNEGNQDKSEETYPKKCVCCPDKVLLNEIQVNTHLLSKQHKKNMRKYKRDNISTAELAKKLEKKERKRLRRKQRQEDARQSKKSNS